MIAWRRALGVAIAALLTTSVAPVAVAKPLHYPPPVQEGVAHRGPPAVTAAAWIVFDESSDTILASQLPDERRAVASVTKVMTALLALERGDLDESVTISRDAAEVGEKEIGLVAGEEVTLGALVKAALIHSGNDAAMAIAEHLGGTVEDFVEMMNQRANELGLVNTRFTNPHGLDAPGHYSTARDMLALAREAMGHVEFRDIVRSRLLVFPPAPDGTMRIGRTTNLLLSEYEGVSGIKTGFTTAALRTFVVTAEREARRLYAVVLGSDGERAHLDDARLLLDYGFEDMRIYGTMVTGVPYLTRASEPSPPPLAEAARIEALAHIATAMTTPPESAVTFTASEPESPRMEVVHRRPAAEPGTLLGALEFWIDGFFRLFGG